MYTCDTVLYLQSSYKPWDTQHTILTNYLAIQIESITTIATATNYIH